MNRTPAEAQILSHLPFKKLLGSGKLRVMWPSTAWLYFLVNYRVKQKYRFLLICKYKRLSNNCGVTSCLTCFSPSFRREKSIQWALRLGRRFFYQSTVGLKSFWMTRCGAVSSDSVHTFVLKLVTFFSCLFSHRTISCSVMQISSVNMLNESPVLM